MLNRYRQRRGPYALAEPSPVGGLLKRLVVLAVLALVLFFFARWVLGALGVGNHVKNKPVALAVEPRSNVTVSLEGGLMQRADSNVPLFAGDKVVSNAGSHAQLSFFDGSMVRLDEQSEVTIDESKQGTKSSVLAVFLGRGAVWVKTPDTTAFTGSITRVVETENYVAYLASDADVVLDQRTIFVFEADDDGVRVEANGATAVVVREGQQLSVPEDESFDGDLKRFRSAMDPLTVQRAFIKESRSLKDLIQTGSAIPETVTGEDLTISTPQDGQTVSGTTVRVQGSAGSQVERIRVNGYPAKISRDQGTYSQELALPTTATFTIRVEALDRTGIIIEQLERTIKVGTSGTSAQAPRITSPGKNGEKVNVAADEFELRGTVPAGTTAVYVNDYKLQLFRVGDTEWSYLASVRLGNLIDGENVYTVLAEDNAGGRSAPAVLTVVRGAAGQTTSGAASSEAPVVSETTLPQNDPLKPGSLAVTAPVPGTSASMTGTGFLLEGTTISETSSVWINGYQLKLYTAGKTFWNYWALEKYSTLKEGTNTYRIVSRNAANQILDVFTYTVEYKKE